MQNSGPWDPWLTVVENSRLFAQRGHSAGTTHGAPPYGGLSAPLRRDWGGSHVCRRHRFPPFGGAGGALEKCGRGHLCPLAACMRPLRGWVRVPYMAPAAALHPHVQAMHWGAECFSQNHSLGQRDQWVHICPGQRGTQARPFLLHVVLPRAELHLEGRLHYGACPCYWVEFVRELQSGYPASCPLLGP